MKKTDNRKQVICTRTAPHHTHKTPLTTSRYITQQLPTGTPQEHRYIAHHVVLLVLAQQEVDAL